MKLLIATGNQGKLVEMKEIFRALPLQLLSLNDLPPLPEVEESGGSFAENAVLKARGYALAARQWTLADDSGLEVAALGGRPGVHSARYGGADLDFTGKIALLLAEVKAAGAKAARPDLSARFVCAMAVSDPAGRVKKLAEGVCPGRLIFEPRGAGGFGYDPIFVPEGFQLTFAELDRNIKQQISHRARAAAEITRYFRDKTHMAT
jgi:XTP/dITP diphosphohydrolase